MRRLLVLLVAGRWRRRSRPPRRRRRRCDARAWIIEDARTGEVLASSNAHERVPIASITKLMTVLVTLEHHKLTDVVDVDPRAAAVGESSADLGPGDELTVSDLIKAALIQSANDAADALALSVAPDFPSFARADEREGAAARADDTHFVRPDGLDAAGHVSSAADVTKLARVVMRIPFVRKTVREETATIAGGRTLHTWDDLLTQFPETIGVKTGHTGLAGWCQVAAARGTRRHGVRDAARQPEPLGAKRRSRVAPRLGALAVSRRARRPAGPHLRVGRRRVRQGAARPRRREAAAAPSHASIAR